MSYDLGGFSVTASTSRVMLIIFAVYSVVIVGFGFYIKYQSKKGGKDGLASFLTGGGGLDGRNLDLRAVLDHLRPLAPPGSAHQSFRPGPGYGQRHGSGRAR